MSSTCVCLSACLSLSRPALSAAFLTPVHFSGQEYSELLDQVGVARQATTHTPRPPCDTLGKLA